jgi:hypothetical protein
MFWTVGRGSYDELFHWNEKGGLLLPYWRFNIVLFFVFLLFVFTVYNTRQLYLLAAFLPSFFPLSRSQSTLTQNVFSLWVSDSCRPLPVLCAFRNVDVFVLHTIMWERVSDGHWTPKWLAKCWLLLHCKKPKTNEGKSNFVYLLAYTPPICSLYISLLIDANIDVDVLVFNFHAITRHTYVHNFFHNPRIIIVLCSIVKKLSAKMFYEFLLVTLLFYILHTHITAINVDPRQKNRHQRNVVIV